MTTVITATNNTSTIPSKYADILNTRNEAEARGTRKNYN